MTFKSSKFMGPFLTWAVFCDKALSPRPQEEKRQQLGTLQNSEIGEYDTEKPGTLSQSHPDSCPDTFPIFTLELPQASLQREEFI